MTKDVSYKQKENPKRITYLKDSLKVETDSQEFKFWFLMMNRKQRRNLAFKKKEESTSKSSKFRKKNVGSFGTAGKIKKGKDGWNTIPKMTLEQNIQRQIDMGIYDYFDTETNKTIRPTVDSVKKKM